MIKEFLLKKKIERSIRISLKNNDKLKKLEDEIFCQVMSIDTDIKFIYQFINKNFSSEPKENPFFWTVVLYICDYITNKYPRPQVFYANETFDWLYETFPAKDLNPFFRDLGLDPLDFIATINRLFLYGDSDNNIENEYDEYLLFLSELGSKQIRLNKESLTFESSELALDPKSYKLLYFHELLFISSRRNLFYLNKKFSDYKEIFGQFFELFFVNDDEQLLRKKIQEIIRSRDFSEMVLFSFNKNFQ